MIDLSRMQCLGEALRDALLTFKTNTALLEADRHRQTAELDYTRLRQEAERVAGCLQREGFEPGDRCAILMSNQFKWVVSGIGAQWAGAVLVPLDYKLTAPELLRLIAHAEPRVLVTEYHLYRDLRAADDADLSGVRVLVTEAPPGVELGDAERWQQPAGAPFALRLRDRDDVACIVYSSGTGGRPKGCMLTHENYLSQAQVLARMFPMEEDDRYFSILPTNHAIDFMCGTIIPFLYGAAVVHQRTLRAEFLAPTLRRYGVTHIALVPRIMRNIEEKIREQLDALPDWKRLMIDSAMGINDLVTQREPNHRLSRTLLKPLHEKFGGRLRMVFAGGAFVDPELAEFFYRLGFPVAIGYGLTEACTVITVNDLRPFRSTTVGKPVEGVEIELRDMDDEGVGEVYARGPTIMRGYLNEPELTADTLVDGWLRTGDRGMIDASGHLRLRGRAKNMIVTAGGKNIYPEDVEVAFERVDCEELCVFAADYLWPRGELGGESLTLVVRPRKGQSEKDLREALLAANRGLADFKRVASVVLWHDEFPRTASMKIKRELLAQAVRAQGAADALREAS
jgi:long-chain acyl-CoA synthetase